MIGCGPAVGWIITLTFVIILISSSEKRSIVLSLQEFKQRINLSDKYIKLSHFKSKVLELVVDEINLVSDIHIEYEDKEYWKSVLPSMRWDDLRKRWVVNEKDYNIYLNL